MKGKSRHPRIGEDTPSYRSGGLFHLSTAHAPQAWHELIRGRMLGLPMLPVGDSNMLRYCVHSQAISGTRACVRYFGETEVGDAGELIDVEGGRGQ